MIYAYLRVSTGSQDGANQRKGVDDFCKARNWHIDEYIDDEGKSGTLEPEKRQLGDLLKKLKPGDILVAGEISRLGRSLFMIMRILEYCMNNGIKVYTVKDNYELGDNITSKVLAFAFGLSAEIEREMISRRTKEALAKLKAEGKRNGGHIVVERLILNRICVQKHEKIVEEIKKETAKVQIAKQLGISITTLYRYLAYTELWTPQSKRENWVKNKIFH
ncbi:MAG: recombinase family protein [Fibrobacter sp.]|nr:recombinase family protein [Fibrobacter sp.]